MEFPGAAETMCGGGEVMRQRATLSYFPLIVLTMVRRICIGLVHAICTVFIHWVRP